MVISTVILSDLSSTMISLLLILLKIRSVILYQTDSVSFNKLETTCGDGSKQSLHVNNPVVYTFNSTVKKKFPCHLELHLHSQSLGFAVFIETLKLQTFMNSDCSKDYLQFGRDKLFVTTYTSEKYCQKIEHTREVRDEETERLLSYDFRNVSYRSREYVEKNDNEMDVWLNLEPSINNQVKEVKLIVVPFRKSCKFEDEKYYRRCPETGLCFKKQFFCSGMVKCDILPDNELRGACIKESEGSDFFYLPIIIIVTVVIIIGTVIIGFGVKLFIKHFNDNGIHNIESSQATSRYQIMKLSIIHSTLICCRTCSPNIVSPATPGTALLTPEREQRRPDSQVTN